jgi:hypothetical protein
MPVAYPSGLPLVLRASKRRSQAAPFVATDPRAGALQTEASGPDTPVVWRVEFRFSSSASAATFRAWFEDDLQRGLLPFTMPIRTEFGLVTHTCRFSPEGLLDARHVGGVWTYSAEIMARAQVIPDAYREAADMIVGLPGWDAWAEFLDRAIAEMPEGT